MTLQSKVIWITGLAGSGKTTLCNALVDEALKKNRNFIKIDGDLIREAINCDLGYAKIDRIQQITRLQKLAKMLQLQNFDVIVCGLYSNSKLLDWNRKNLINYTEVYLKAPLNFLTDRDQKNLYSKAQNGHMKNVVGFDIAWNEPKFSDFVFDASKETSPAEMALSILSYINNSPNKAIKK